MASKARPRSSIGVRPLQISAPEDAARVLQDAFRNSPPKRPPALPPTAASTEREKTRMVVGVRVRPLSTAEQAKGAHSCLTVEQGTQVFAKDPDEKMAGSRSWAAGRHDCRRRTVTPAAERRCRPSPPASATPSRRLT